MPLKAPPKKTSTFPPKPTPVEPKPIEHNDEIPGLERAPEPESGLPLPPKVKTPAPAPPMPIIPTITEEDDGLPYEDTDQQVNMSSLRWLFVAPPGFGKSEFFALFPNSLMLACEEGHKFITGKKIIIDTWAGTQTLEDTDGNKHMSFLRAVDLIENSQRFDFIIIDTLDALIKKCIDHHIIKANQTHLSDLGEYGKGYDLGQNDPIRRALNTILTSGRGMGIITHQQVETKNFGKGPKAKKETTLPNGIFKLVYPQMDIIIHGEFGVQREGNDYRDRIIRSEGSEDILAKNRGGILPPAWISARDPAERAAEVQEFFTGTPAERQAAVAKAYAAACEIYALD